MRRRTCLSLSTGVLLVAAALVQPVGPARAADGTPVYYTLPAGYAVSNFGVTADGSGDLWFGVEGPPRGSQPTPSLARLHPASAVAGTSAGVDVLATPDSSPATCCANQLRSVTFNPDDGRVYYVRNDGAYGSLLPAAPAGSLRSGSLGANQDLWDVAPAQGGGAWFTEYSASNTAPAYPGSRIARLLVGGEVQEGPNTAVQGGATTIDSTRYDAKPSGITVDASGRPWFVEENPGLPGYRIATYGGAGSYSEYLAAPCSSTGPCSGSNTGIGLTDVAVAADGSIWFTNYLKSTFGRFDPATSQVTQYALSAVSSTLAGSSPRQIIAAPDGTLWLTVTGGFSAPKALVRVVPGTGAASPTATFTALGSKAPLGLTATSTDIWFGASDVGAGTTSLGRLAGVVGSAAGGGGGGGTPGTTTTPPATTTAASTPAVTLAPVSVGRTTLDPPQSRNGEIDTNQVCVGPPEARCAVVYLVREHEYTTGFRSQDAAASPGALGRKPARRPKPRRLAGTTVVLHGGQSREVSLRLNGLGRRILASRGRVRVDVVISETSVGGGNRVLSKKSLTVRSHGERGKSSAAVAADRRPPPLNPASTPTPAQPSERR